MGMGCGWRDYKKWQKEGLLEGKAGIKRQAMLSQDLEAEQERYSWAATGSSSLGLKDSGQEEG